MLPNTAHIILIAYRDSAVQTMRGIEAVEGEEVLAANLEAGARVARLTPIIRRPIDS